jgi:hypothetical protein
MIFELLWLLKVRSSLVWLPGSGSELRLKGGSGSALKPMPIHGTEIRENVQFRGRDLLFTFGLFRFQNKENAPIEVFKTEWKGFGIRATAKIPKVRWQIFKIFLLFYFLFFFEWSLAGRALLDVDSCRLKTELLQKLQFCLPYCSQDTVKYIPHWISEARVSVPELSRLRA